jgi:PIN domain nuclease of toxin-antitoxin system
MMKIIDAHALLIFLEKETGYKKIESCLLSAVEKEHQLLMSSVNFGEVYNVVLKACGQKKADEVERIIRTLPIDIVPVDRQMAKEAARLKAKKKISFFLCFAAALAKLCRGELITGDREFKALKDKIKISWIS